ncbi:rhodanese-like domain-containing protein [Myroides injenensis]|uniref:rhodanese-like domain-containing protein n=1 Tax=Myroides injenensis TaxID=1183151 RepID=UPI0002EA7AB2|nr:rhodanese-like domain-containing protein [Myroides injenensis]
MKKLFLTVFAFLAVFCSISAQEIKGKELLSKEEFELVTSQNGIQLVDVRTSKEFKEGTIGKAINIDFLSDDFIKQTTNLNKQEPVYIFCKSGKRSAAAKKELLENGFTKVIELEGGYSEWLSKQK